MEEEEDDDIYGLDEKPTPSNLDIVERPSNGNGLAPKDEESGEELEEEESDSVRNLLCNPSLSISRDFRI